MMPDSVLRRMLNGLFGRIGRNFGGSTPPFLARRHQKRTVERAEEQLAARLVVRNANVSITGYGGAALAAEER
jgi:hypothetical protein